MSVDIEKLQTYSDNRGWVSEIYAGEWGDDLQNIHLGTMHPGAVRGNHSHTQSKECIIFLEGPIYLRSETDGNTQSETIRTPVKVSISPNTAHAFKNVGTNTISFVAYRNKEYDDENPDVTSVELIPGQ